MRAGFERPSSLPPSLRTEEEAAAAAEAAFLGIAPCLSMGARYRMDRTQGKNWNAPSQQIIPEKR